MTAVRAAAVAGRFYPGDARRLRADLDAYLRTDNRPAPVPKAVIAPHAGYVFSGLVAGTVFAQLAGADHITRVVLLGPAHTVALRGMAVTAADAWDTPLGRIPIDTATTTHVAAHHDMVAIDDRPHRSEHCLEVQLPFLQQTIGDFELVPVIVGDTPADAVADLLDDVWGGDETLIVISTDLSHYLRHDVASQHDRTTCAHITDLDEDSLDHGDACGYFPLRGLLVAARRHGLDVELVDRRTSAETAGDPDRVVGYAAFRADPVEDAGPPTEPDTTELEPLLDVAADAIAARLRGERPPRLSPTGALGDHGAAFVSLHRGGRLLGCIGTLDARRALAEEVADKAVAAAFSDPRLPPITADDFQHMEIEVSVLTESQPLDVGGYDELVRSIGPRDGITVQAGRHRATLLPVMWKQDPDPGEFVATLWQKAGLRPHAWPRGIRVERYGSAEVTDPGPRPPI